MLSNLHTHTTFCDGKHTVDEIVQCAIENRFDSIGFSGHGYTDFDLSYCMKDTDGYIAAVNAAKQRFAGQIEVYLGVEEDAFYPLPNRRDFDYVIGSSHYFKIDNKYFPIDSTPEYFEQCVKAFDGDYMALAETYYRAFCEYILKWKPDIVGHFDLITKFDERESSRFLNNAAYHDLADRYVREALKSGCLFEVNTGAISRGYRTSPYPSLPLLHTIHKNDGNVILSSDCHHKDTLSCFFTETRAILRDIGFTYVYALQHGRFTKQYL